MTKPKKFWQSLDCGVTEFLDKRTNSCTVVYMYAGPTDKYTDKQAGLAISA